MKFLPLVWRNLLRRKVRTIFTILSIFIAFVLFGVLMAIRMAFSMGVDMAGQGRLMVIDKVSIINPLPASYEQQLKQIEGVQDVTHSNWFGGYYQEVKNQFATFAVDPESWLRVYPKEFDLPDDQKKAWFADRTGAIVGADTAKKYGWKVGQKVPIQGTIYRRPDGGPWEFTIDGIYDSKLKGADKTNFIFNYQFLRETIPAPERVPRQVQLVRVHDRRSRPRAADRRENRCDVRQLSVGDQDQHRKGVRLRLGQAGRRHRQDHDVDRRHGALHHSARHGQHDGAGGTGADQRARGAQDPRLRRRPDSEDGAARIDADRDRRRSVRPRRRVHAHLAAAIPREVSSRPFTSRRRMSSRASRSSLFLGLAAGSLPALQAGRLRIVDALRRN